MTAGGGANACGSARLVKRVRYTSLIGKFASTPMPLFFGLQKLADREAYQYLCPKFWQDYCDYQREKLLGGNDRPVRIHDRAKKIRVPSNLLENLDLFIRLSKAANFASYLDQTEFRAFPISCLPISPRPTPSIAQVLVSLRDQD